MCLLFLIFKIFFQTTGLFVFKLKMFFQYIQYLLEVMKIHLFLKFSFKLDMIFKNQFRNYSLLNDFNNEF